MILPMITGNIAPPIIDITMSDEAGLVFSFKSLIPKEKIVGLFFTNIYPATHGDIHDRFKVLMYQAIND